MIGAIERPRYVPSGRVDWLKFLPLLLLSLLCAAVLAAALYGLYFEGWYLIILVPAIAAMLLSVMLSFAVRAGKCRSPLLAGALGLVAGVVMYIGYYYIGMVAMLGPQYATRLDLLPAYISWRAHVDVQHDVGGPRLPHDQDSADAPMNWFLFAFELGLVLFVTLLVTRRRASRAFCESCGSWKTQHVALFAPGFGKQIAEWLDAGQLPMIASLPPFKAGRRQQFTSVAVEVCPLTAASQNCPAYLAVKDVSLGGGGTEFQKFDGATGKVLVQRAQISAEELASIRQLFPALSGIAATPAQIPTGAAGARIPPPIPAGLSRSQLIEVTPIPPADARKVMNGWTIAVGNLLSLVIVAAMILFAAGIFAGIFLSGLPELMDHKGSPPNLARVVAGLALSAVCLVLCILSGYVGLKNSSFLGNRYYLGRAKRFFSLRRDRIVDPDRTSNLPTFFVEVVPRRNWGKLMLETATDVGFLQVDARRGEIRFEGDCERYRIPARAIRDCAIEQIVMSAGQSTITYYAVVISGDTATGPWEAPFIARQTRALVAPSHRRQSGDAIYASVMSAVPEPAASYTPDDSAPADLAGVAGATPALSYSVSAVPPPRVSFWRTYGLRLAIIPLAIAFGVWRGLAHHNARSKPSGISAIQAAHRGPSLPMHISNIRTGQKLVDSPPYYAPGGTWTLFDCVPTADARARFTVAVDQPPPPKGELPVSFSKAALLPGDRASGEQLVAAFASTFQQPVPTPRSPQPLKPVKLNTAVLGEHLGAPRLGLKENGGTWVATKWFLQDNGLDAEVYFDYDLSSGEAEFHQKDAEYDADLVESIALAVRDGPRPPRTPQNDPNLTDAGPHIENAQLIPNSAERSADFARGGKLLILSSFRPPSEAWAVPLDAPDQRIDLLKSDVILESVLCADADGNHVLACERFSKDATEIDPDDRHQIVWVDRTSGRREELTGPWGALGMLFGEASISPDAHYAGIGGWVDVPAQHQRRAIIHFYDLRARTCATADVSGESLELVGWTGDAAARRAVLLTGDRFDNLARRAFLADPATGVATPADGSALPPSADPARSPDGKRRYVLHEKKSLDIIDVATGATRTFTFHEDDRHFAVDGCVTWLSPRFLEFDTSKQGFIDVESMKMSYVPESSPEKPGWKFSPDFKWAVQTTKSGIVFGKVVVP